MTPSDDHASAADPGQQEVCLCFHVTRRKLENFLRIERPPWLSQLSECQGAGTGCGWCRPVLQRLFAKFRGGEPADGAHADEVLPSADEYAAQRAIYRQQQSAAADGTSPGT